MPQLKQALPTLIAMIIGASAAYVAHAIQPDYRLPSLNELLPRPQEQFDGERALEDIKTQLSFGPRIPGEEGHFVFREWLGGQLYQAGWQVKEQVSLSPDGREIRNVVAYRLGMEEPPKGWVVLGAHYDTRIVADEDLDPAKRAYPVPGANDGASGVAVLLELARVLPEDAPVWLVFFDAEDNGRIPGWDWILGSREFVAQLEKKPTAAVIVDMVGDRELNLPIEQNSSPRLVAEIWGQAAALGYSDRFLSTPGYRMLDDHTPFLEAGIPAVDIIDFDYPYWHTTEDTLDKVSAESLQAVGDTVLAWLLNRQP